MSRKISSRFDETEIDAIFADVDQCHLPGAAVGIAIDGVPVYRKGFGLANMELPTLLTPSMRMRIGSTTKHFTALAYMLLCEDGFAGIDDEIATHLPDLPKSIRRATMRQLMTHTSGIRDPLSITILTNGVNHPVTDQDMIAYYRTIDDVDFAPGTHWSYNHGGYCLISAAIEAITGKTLEDVLRERIFEPVGMFDTILRRWDSDFVPNSATLHFQDEGGNWSRTYMGLELSGGGGIASTVDDMLRWLRHMDSPTVGTAATWALMREPQLLRGGRSTGYGLGLMSGTYRGTEILHHAGAVMGGSSQMIKVRAAKLDISVAVNRGDLSAALLANRIIDVCVAGLDPTTEKTEHEKRVGTFRSKTSGRVVTLSVSDGLHLMSVDGRAPVAVSPDGADILRFPDTLDFIKQSVSMQGDAIVLSDFDSEDVLDKIADHGEATIGDRAGTYRSDAIDATILVEDRSSGLRAVIHGRHGLAYYQLEPINIDIWRIENSAMPMMSAILTFDTDCGGLTIDMTWARRLHFARTYGP
jgi:D-aminopeptidase